MSHVYVTVSQRLLKLVFHLGLRCILSKVYWIYELLLWSAYDMMQSKLTFFSPQSKLRSNDTQIRSKSTSPQKFVHFRFHWFLYKYIFHYKYVASAVIYFECGWRIPKSIRNGEKMVMVMVVQGTYVLWKVKSSSSSEVWWSCYQFWYDDFPFFKQTNMSIFNITLFA